jgi:hypothetical protein
VHHGSVVAPRPSGQGGHGTTVGPVEAQRPVCL